MGVIVTEIRSVPVGPKNARRLEDREVTTYHARLNCDRMPESAVAIVPADDPGDTWECAFCDDGPVVEVVPEDADNEPLPELRNGGRDGARRNQYGDANRPSEKQDGFIRSLLRTLGRDADEQIAEWTRRGVYTKREASRLIDELIAERDTRPADQVVQDDPSEKQVGFLRSLLARKGHDVDASIEAAKAEGRFTKRAVSQWIETLKAEPDAPRPTTDEAPEGIHFHEGTVYKVQVAVHGSGQKYAKVLVVPEARGGKGEWEYHGRKRPFHQLSESTLMTREQAAEFGHLYGMCAVCGATLTDETSIDRGIGPVCYGRLAH